MLKRYNVRLLKIHKLLFAQTELQTIQDKAKNLNRNTISPLDLVSFEKLRSSGARHEGSRL